jgi:hypothetical protein
LGVPNRTGALLAFLSTSQSISRLGSVVNDPLCCTGYYDPSDPFNNNAKPNSWTPPLTQSWDFLNDKIFGVNLGGWLVLEPFITPQLYQKYPTATDEWTLSQAMAADTGPSGGLESQMEAHYSTFIVRPISRLFLLALTCPRLHTLYCRALLLDTFICRRSKILPRSQAQA